MNRVIEDFHAWVNAGPKPRQRMIDIVSPANKRPLNGTPLQEKWAKTIRLKMAKQLQELGLARICLHLKPVITSVDLDSINCNTPAKLARLIKATIRNCFIEKSSKWWIDNKEMKGYELLRPSYHATIIRFQKNPKRWN